MMTENPGPRVERPVGDWWVRAMVAGACGGVAMALWQMLAAGIQGIGLWMPMNAVGTAGRFISPPPGNFVPGSSLAGLVMHGAIGAFLGLIFAAVLYNILVPRLRGTAAESVVAGGVLGLTTWAFLGMIVGPLVTPSLIWVQGTIPWSFFASHLVFGLVTSLILYATAPRRGQPTVTFAPDEEARARAAASRAASRPEERL